MIELEKKWLVDKQKLSGLMRLIIENDSDTLETEQGYLENTKDDSWIVRYRHIFVHPSEEDYFYLDLKSKGLLAREEISHKISKEEFLEGIKKCEGRIVRKIRYCYVLNGHMLEIDIYNDHEFVTCEVEFKNMKEANDYVPPIWCVEDITFDPKYKNMNLGV